MDKNEEKEGSHPFPMGNVNMMHPQNGDFFEQGPGDGHHHMGASYSQLPKGSPAPFMNPVQPSPQPLIYTTVDEWNMQQFKLFQHFLNYLEVRMPNSQDNPFGSSIQMNDPFERTNAQIMEYNKFVSYIYSLSSMQNQIAQQHMGANIHTRTQPPQTPQKDQMENKTTVHTGMHEDE